MSAQQSNSLDSALKRAGHLFPLVIAYFAVYYLIAPPILWMVLFSHTNPEDYKEVINKTLSSWQLWTWLGYTIILTLVLINAYSY